MPVYIPPNRNLVPSTAQGTGAYTKPEADSRFVHNFGNELITGVKIFSNTAQFSNSIQLTNVTPQQVLTTDVSGVVMPSGYGINDLALKNTTDSISGKLDGEIANRISGDNYLQQQINQVSSAQYLVFSEQFSGNGVSKQFQLNGTVTNAKFISGGWNVINVQNALPSNITDINGNVIYDAGVISLFTRHRIGVNSITGNAYVNLDYIPQNNQIFKLWYWYSLSDFDRIDNYYRDDYVAKMEEVAGELATGTAVNTVNFGNILSTSDDTVQKALDTIDDNAIPKTEVSNISSGLQTQLNSNQTTLSRLTSTSAAYIAYSNSTSANALVQSQVYTNIISGYLSNNIAGISQSLSGYINPSYLNPLTGALQTQLNSNQTTLSRLTSTSAAYISYSNSTSSNAFTQAQAYTNTASGNLIQYINSGSSSVTQASVAAASANAYTQSQIYTNTTSGNLIQYINTSISSISSSGGLLQGSVVCDTVNIVYTISHPNIDIDYSYPTISLLVPLSGSNLFVQGVSNRTTTSFQVTLSEVPNISGYQIMWHLPTTSKNIVGTSVINQSMSTLPSINIDVSGTYTIQFTDTIVYVNTNIIYLPSVPSMNEHHWIVNTYGNNISLDGNGKNIWNNGSINSTCLISSNSSIHLHYNQVKDKWYNII